MSTSPSTTDDDTFGVHSPSHSHSHSSLSTVVRLNACSFYKTLVKRLFAHESVRAGRLEGVTCSFEDYLDLDGDNEERYDLVDGVMVQDLDMRDSMHNFLVAGVIAIIEDQYKRGKHSFWPYRGERIQIPPSEPFCRPGSFVGRTTSRRGDVVVTDVSGENRRARIIFTLETPAPHTVVEVTCYSSSREVDLNAKMDDYARRGIKEYIVLDRGKRESSEYCVVVGTLSEGAKYTKRVYKGEDKVRCYFFNGMTARQLFTPPDERLLIRRRQEERRNLEDINRRLKTDNQRLKTDNQRLTAEFNRLNTEKRRLLLENEQLRRELELMRCPMRKKSNVETPGSEKYDCSLEGS